MDNQVESSYRQTIIVVTGLIIKSSFNYNYAQITTTLIYKAKKLRIL